jgi:hypothetical protein
VGSSGKEDTGIRQCDGIGIRCLPIEPFGNMAPLVGATPPTSILGELRGQITTNSGISLKTVDPTADIQTVISDQAKNKLAAGATSINDL